MPRVLALALVVMVASGCGARTVATQPLALPTSGGAAEVATEAPPAPQGASGGEPTTVAVNEPATVLENGQPLMKITVSKVSTHASYSGDYGKDTPERKGDVFIQAYVTYQALADGADYNEFDWQVFVAGEAVDNWPSVLFGPTPQLSSGTLPKGRKASGWVVYEVPKTGEVRMSYGGAYGQAPVFEVVTRSK